MAIEVENSNSGYPKRFESMSPEKKLNLSMELYYTARELKRAWLKLQHPGWDQTTLDRKLREIFTHAGT